MSAPVKTMAFTGLLDRLPVEARLLIYQHLCAEASEGGPDHPHIFPGLTPFVICPTEKITTLFGSRIAGELLDHMFRNRTFTILMNEELHYLEEPSPEEAILWNIEGNLMLPDPNVCQPMLAHVETLHIYVNLSIYNKELKTYKPENGVVLRCLSFLLPLLRTAKRLKHLCIFVENSPPRNMFRNRPGNELNFIYAQLEHVKDQVPAFRGAEVRLAKRNSRIGVGILENTPNFRLCHSEWQNRVGARLFHLSRVCCFDPKSSHWAKEAHMVPPSWNKRPIY